VLPSPCNSFIQPSIISNSIWLPGKTKAAITRSPQHSTNQIPFYLATQFTTEQHRCTSPARTGRPALGTLVRSSNIRDPPRLARRTQARRACSTRLPWSASLGLLPAATPVRQLAALHQQVSASAATNSWSCELVSFFVSIWVQLRLASVFASQVSRLPVVQHPASVCCRRARKVFDTLPVRGWLQFIYFPVPSVCPSAYYFAMIFASPAPHCYSLLPVGGYFDYFRYIHSNLVIILRSKSRDTRLSLYFWIFIFCMHQKHSFGITYHI
jgi:hypothetical protein